MKKTLITVIVAFAGGIAGSFFYQHYVGEKNTQQQDSVRLIHDYPGYFINQAESIAETSGEEVERNAQEPLIVRESNSAVLATTDFVQASKISTPCVVYIKTVTQNTYASSWMDWFFGGGTGQSISSGSGVIYSSDGYIITNQHVIGNADNIEVVIGKRTYDAVVIGTDPSADMAVLKIDATNLPAIKVGSSRNVQIGDWVLAVGNPFNLTSTVTAGIVSAKGRELNITRDRFPIESFIQTDAAINPGNSGGALVNLSGELIGINTAILSKTGSYAGYGFAVPSDIVKKIADDLIRYGEVQKAFLGVEVMDINSQIAANLEIDDFSGVVVSYVQQDGAGARIGLQKGDVILKLDNQVIDSRSQFEEALSYKSPGEKLSVVYKRKQKIVNNSATLTNREGTTEVLKREIYTSRTLGADFEKVSKVERDLLNIEYGVRIARVRSGLISQMNLGEGFIITHLNKVPIKDPETLTDILSKIRGRVYVEGINKQGRKEFYRYYF